MGTKILASIDQFLKNYPGMSIAPYSGRNFHLYGNFRFIANVSGGEEIKDCYKLEIIVPKEFPNALPIVKEIDGKIPRNETFHVNTDGSLCLASPLRLLKKIYNSPNLKGFAERCLIPYLYSVSYKLKNGGNFIFGELLHGEQGILDDYSQMFKLSKKSHIIQAVKLLGMKKRIANKKQCPCGCGRRLGACSFRHKLNDFRKMAPVCWFKDHAIE